AGGVSSVEVIIARLWRIVAARIADAVVNGVMPIVVVIGCYAVPPTIMRFERIMRPALTSIGTSHHDILPLESERPDVRRMRVNDTWLDGRRSGRLRRRTIRWNRPRELILNVRIPFYTRHVLPGSQCLSHVAGALH